MFRFDATRFIGHLRVDDPDANQLLESILFEVQVRTAFEHAWSVATHTPAYKPSKADWKLERLAAQMKALVEQLDLLAVDYERSASPIVEHPCERTACETKILEMFQGLLRDGVAPIECEPERWGLFSRNVYGLAEAADFGRRMFRDEKVRLICSEVDAAARAMPKGSFPVSISLFQFAVGVIVQSELVRPEFDRNYFLPISSALEVLFPKTREANPRCDLSP